MPVLSLKTKMSLAVSLLMAVVLALLALSAFWYFERQFKDTISRQQFTLVSVLAEEIDNKILNAQQELVATAGSITANLADNPTQARYFLGTQAGIRTVFDSGINIFSPNGRLIAASPPEPQLQGRDYSFRNYIKNTISTGKPQISNPFFSTQQHHHPIIMFTAPFFDSKGKLTGILAGGVDLMRDNFLGKLATIKIGEKGYLYLYSTDRTMIVHRDRARILRRDVPPGANRLFDRAIEGFEGTAETVNSKGKLLLSSFKRLRANNWILAANYPQAEVYAPIDMAKRTFLAVMIVVLLVSILAVWWFTRHLTAPLLLFTRHVKDITGNWDEPKTIRVPSHDEIGTLALAFNEMMVKMHEHKMAIREQKEFSENLLLNSAVPTFVLDSRHRVIIWNKACEEMTGINAAELLGTSDSWKGFYRRRHNVLADIVIDGTIDELQLNYSSYNNSPFTPDGLQAEGWYRTSDGRERYVFFDAVPVRNADSEVIAVIQTIQDITGRKRAEEELEFKNVILSTQQETSIDGILVVDEANTIISYNRRFVDLWAIPPELVEAEDDEPVLQLVATRVADPESFVARVKQLYESRDEKSREEILLKDGRVIDRYSAPMLGTDGKYYGRVWYLRDITKRKRMEESLMESELRYRSLVELSPDAIFIHSDGLLVFSNVMGAKLLGAERPEELYGRRAFDFVHPDYLDIVRTRIEQARQQGVSSPLIEELFVRLDGSIVPVDVTSISFNYQGKDAVLVVARDIGERKKMQEELLKAQKLESLGVLAGGIAHDFNNILTGILGSLSISRLQLEPSHKIARHLEQCEKAAIQAGELARQLLTFSRGGEPVKKLMELTSLVREASAFVLSGSNVSSYIEMADDLWCIEADEGQLNQVLHNLLLNAVQAMPEGGELRVRAVNETLEPDNRCQLQSGNYLKISVEDRGYGIPQENLARIFDPYFTTKPQGSGMGLASVYSIVKRHGGAVEVSSTIGVGTRFVIHLPALPGLQPECSGVKESSRFVGKGRILVMDDEAIIREIATDILQYVGYYVESCADGRDAVERYLASRQGNTPFSAVILDLTVPGGMGGKEAASLILEADPHAVLIVSSGYSNDPVVANYRQYGFSGAMPKPFGAAAMARELDKLLSGN